MKKVLSAIILIAVFLSAAGCSDINGSEHGTGGQNEDVTIGAFEVVSGIYLCDDVYLTDETPSYGDGYVYFPIRSDIFDVTDFKLLLCDDECDRADVVSRASQGYAPAYKVAETHEFSGKRPIHKFKMQIPEEMAKSLKDQGIFDRVTEEIGSCYYYLVVLENDIYAYICLERKEDATEYESESKYADDYIKTAVFTLNRGVSSIPFEENQLYAVACLGYNVDGDVPDYSFYERAFLESVDIQKHRVSQGEWYLIIPRYENMTLKLYKNDLETSESRLFYESDVSLPFLVSCNISDIFPDLTVELSHNGETVSFSPFISLKDGSVVVGERGLDITK